MKSGALVDILTRLRDRGLLPRFVIDEVRGFFAAKCSYGLRNSEPTVVDETGYPFRSFARQSGKHD